MENNQLKEELRQLSKKTMENQEILKHLRDKLKSKELKDVLAQIIDNIQTHIRSLAALAIAEHEKPQEDGMMDSLTNMVESIKELSLSTDKEVLMKAMATIEEEKKAIQEFNEKQYALSDNVNKILQIMMDDVQSFYPMLHKFLLEYK